MFCPKSRRLRVQESKLPPGMRLLLLELAHAQRRLVGRRLFSLTDSSLVEEFQRAEIHTKVVDGGVWFSLSPGKRPL